MTHVFMTVMLLFGAAPIDEPPPHVRDYFKRCEAARQATVAAVEKEIESLEALGESKADVARKLKAAREELTRLKSQPAPPATLPMPPRKDDVGAFAILTVEGRRGRYVDVREVIDSRNVIIRVWYVPAVDGKPGAVAKDPVPLDLWAQGIDTSGMKDHSKAELSQVFVLVGNKTFPTDCGTRTLPMVEPIDVERFWGGDVDRIQK